MATHKEVSPQTRDEFQKAHSFKVRQAEAKRICEKYPDRIPVFVGRRSDDSLPHLDKHKFLAPTELSVGGFIYVVRKRLKLTAETGIYLFVNNQLLSGTTMLQAAYSEFKDEDGFLYITYSSESTFGAPLNRDCAATRLRLSIALAAPFTPPLRGFVHSASQLLSL